MKRLKWSSVFRCNNEIGSRRYWRTIAQLDDYNVRLECSGWNWWKLSVNNCWTIARFRGLDRAKRGARPAIRRWAAGLLDAANGTPEVRATEESA